MKAKKSPTNEAELHRFMAQVNAGSYKEVALRSGISPAAFSMIRYGQLRLIPKNAYCLCQTLNITPEKLYATLGINDNSDLEAAKEYYKIRGPRGKQFLHRAYEMAIQEIQFAYRTKDDTGKKQILGSLFRILGKEYDLPESQFVNFEGLLETIVQYSLELQ